MSGSKRIADANSAENGPFIRTELTTRSLRLQLDETKEVLVSIEMNGKTFVVGMDNDGMTLGFGDAVIVYSWPTVLRALTGKDFNADS